MFEISSTWKSTFPEAYAGVLVMRDVANRELIARFEKKIQATLAQVWGKEEPHRPRPGPTSYAIIHFRGEAWPKRR